MRTNKRTLNLLGILLLAGLAGAIPCVPVARGAAIQGEVVLPQVVPAWEQVNSNGFGDPQTSEVAALGAFNGYLYAGAHNPVDPEPLFDGAQIFRAQDGMTWTAVTQPGFGIAHDIAPPAILDLTVFNGRLYASTGRGDGPGQIWRTLNGVTWAPMVIHGFNNPDTRDVGALAEYGGMIYAGASNLVSGAQIWRSFTGDSNTWQAVTPPASTMAGAGVTSFALFDGALWAVVESEAPVEIWYSYGGDWAVAVNDGFGDGETTMTGGMAEFMGQLYVGAGNALNGAQLWRTSDGAIWQPAITPGFGDPNNQAVETVFVFQHQLYVGTRNTQTGAELWRSNNGADWEQVNPDGFGDSNNTGSNRSNAAADFLNQLYVGTSNLVDGGELWRMRPPCADVTPPAGVDIADIQSVAARWGMTSSDPNWNPSFDLEPNGVIDVNDIIAAAAAWGTTC